MNPVEKYFSAERWYCGGGIGIGLVAISLAAYFFLKIKQPFYTGMGWSFMVLGFFFLIICIGVFIRSPKDIERVNAIVQSNPAQLQQEEIPRMDGVMRNFKVIMIVEASLIVICIALIFFGNVSDTWRGAFSGILIMAFLLLCFDWLANSRGKEYQTFLTEQVR
jgi:hypothetical protein